MRNLALSAPSDSEPLIEVEYVSQAEIWRINHGWRRPGDHNGFVIDSNTGIWKRQSDDDDAPNGAPFRATRGQIRPYVSDTRNLLLLRAVSEPVEEDFLRTLAYALRRAIQLDYQIEEQEIAVEQVGLEAHRRIIFWEAAEGGIGVWERLIGEPGAFPQLAKTALTVLHFDGTTGEEPPGWQERCPAACYDCLLSYANQLDHRYLDRHHVRDFLLRLAGAEPIKSGERSYDEQYARLRDRTDQASPFERAFLDHLHEERLRLPDVAQHTPATDVFIQPDFYYARAMTPGICIFIDAPHHKDATRRDEDRRGREALEDRGYRVIAIEADRSIAKQIGRYPDVFYAESV